MPKKPGRMKGLGDEARARTDADLADQELELLRTTTIDWESLRPQVDDDEAYDELIDAVNTATARNEDIAQLKKRLTTLSDAAWNLLKKVIGLIT